MARPDALQAEGVIMVELPNGRWRVELPNGHRLVVWRGRNEAGSPVALGEKVRVQISPCDFSHGRLLK